MSSHITVFGLLLSALIILFNAIQIYTILMDGKKKKIALPILFILNLSISDLFMGCVLTAMIATGQGIVIVDKNLRILSPLSTVLFSISLAVSSGMLVAITIDRLLSVAAPMKYRQRRRKTVLSCIALTWLLVTTYCVVNIYVVYPRYPYFYHKIDFAIFSLFTLFTIFLMIVCYAFILYYIRKQNKKMSATQVSSSSSSQSARRELREAKMRKIAFAVVSSYVICFAPNSIKYLLVLLDVIKLVQIPALSYLMISNSLWNTLLYFGCVRQKIYRKAKKLFTC